MSDYNERACTKCGSLLHHEDDCNQAMTIPPDAPMPCPFCGAKLLLTIESVPQTNGNKRFIRCAQCYSCGPQQSVIHGRDPFELWNSRTPSTPPARENAGEIKQEIDDMLRRNGWEPSPSPTPQLEELATKLARELVPQWMNPQYYAQYRDAKRICLTALKSAGEAGEREHARKVEELIVAVSHARHGVSGLCCQLRKEAVDAANEHIRKEADARQEATLLRAQLASVSAEKEALAAQLAKGGGK